MHPVPSPRAEQAVGAFAALGSPLRFRIMLALAGLSADGAAVDPCAGCEIVCACRLRLLLGISAPDLSHHLNVLKRAGLIESHREGKLIYYLARAQALLALTPLLQELAGPTRPAAYEPAAGGGSAAA